MEFREKLTGDPDHDRLLVSIDRYRDFCRECWHSYSGGKFHPVYDEHGFIIGAYNNETKEERLYEQV